MQRSIKDNNVFFARQGEVIYGSTAPLEQGWYFWDEAGQIGGGPHPTEDAAITALQEYVKWLTK